MFASLVIVNDNISGFGCTDIHQRTTIVLPWPSTVERYFAFQLNGYHFLIVLLNQYNHLSLVTHHSICGYQFSIWGVLRDHDSESNETHKMNIVRFHLIDICQSILIWFDHNLTNLWLHKHKTPNTYKKRERIPKNLCPSIFVCLFKNNIWFSGGGIDWN